MTQPYDFDPLMPIGELAVQRHRAKDLERSAQSAYNRVRREAHKDPDQHREALRTAEQNLADAKARYERADRIYWMANMAELGEKAAKASAQRPRPATHRLAGQALRDASGKDLRPNLLDVRTPAQLAEALCAFRAWAGDPSYRDMVKTAAEANVRLAIGAISKAFNMKDELVRQEVIQKVIIGCGGNKDDVQNFTTAWRQIRMKETPVKPMADPRPDLRPVPSNRKTG